VGGSFKRSFDNTHNPKISSRYDIPIQNGDRLNAERMTAK